MRRSETRPARRFWRDPKGALPNTLAIAYALFGYAGGLALMTRGSLESNLAGVILCAHAMMIAAYLIHEAAHHTIFASALSNRVLGEAMSFVSGGSYASFERIRHLHLRHHVERVDVGCFDYKAFLRRRPKAVVKIVLALEWFYVPAVELIMHAQVIVRPFVEPGQRRYLRRVICMLALRGGAFGSLAYFVPKAGLLYALSYGLLLTGLSFMDAFHHTYEQFFVAEDGEISGERPDRGYERKNTFSNVISTRHPWLNLLILNFGYHNAHHERVSAPWYRLPALQAKVFPQMDRELVPVGELLRTFHKNRVRRVLDDDYGALGTGPGRANGFVGAHGVSFLSVV